MKLSCCDRSNLVQFVMKTKQDNDMIDNIGLVYIKTKLNCRDISDRVQSVMKTRQENNLTDCRGVVYAENKIEIS